MPHIAVKLWPGRSEEEKTAFARAVAKTAFARAVADDAARYLHADKAWVSVSIEEIEPEAWEETVVRPEILEKPDVQYVRSE